MSGGVTWIMRSQFLGWICNGAAGVFPNRPIAFFGSGQSRIGQCFWEHPGGFWGDSKWSHFARRKWMKQTI